MPRVTGVSTTSTERLMRRRPRPCTVASCVLLKTIWLTTSVIVTFSPLSFAALLAIAAHHVFEILAAEPRDERRVLEAEERRERRAHDVVVVRRSERLGHDARHAGRLDDRAHAAARDDAGA